MSSTSTVASSSDAAGATAKTDPEVAGGADVDAAVNPAAEAPPATPPAPSWMDRAYAAVRAEGLLVAVLVSSFLARWLIADRTSYWNDELLSVHVYGGWHDSVGGAISQLAENSIHPPAYQFMLYQWMEIFGDTERATRSLSNLYVTLTTLFLYLLLRNGFSRRVALASAAVFALMHTAVYYGLESRSYAQTIFLATLSSYALLRMMRRGGTAGWRSAVLSPTVAVFIFANTALLLTHYYNVFFWVAQAAVAGIFVLRERSPRGWLAGLGVVAGIFLAQGALFALVWGRFLIDGYQRRSGAFPAEGNIRSPLELLESVVTPNFNPPQVLFGFGVLFLVVVAFRALVVVARSGEFDPQRRQAWTVIYLLAWLVMPLVVTYVAFVLTGVARYSPRYWLFIVPPMAALAVLAVREAVQIITWALQHVPHVRIHPTWPVLVAAAALAGLVLPGTLAAATETKHDWRGTAQQVVHLVRADPDASYIIYETSHRRESMANYYFERFDREVAIYDTVQRSEERRGTYRILTEQEPIVNDHDYLVLIFTHQRTEHFPVLLEQLEQRYEVRHRQLNRSGRGFMVFDIHSPPSSPETAPNVSS